MGKNKDKYMHVLQSRKKAEVPMKSPINSSNVLSFMKSKKEWSWTHLTGITALISVIIAINVALISTNIAKGGSLLGDDNNYTFLPSIHYFPAHVAQRMEGMNRHGHVFHYNLTGVDKRDNLSLEEFNDVYNGKWPVIITDVVPKWGAFHWSKAFFYKYYGQERVVMVAVENGQISSGEGLALPLALFCKHAHEGAPSMWTYVQDELFIPNRPQLLKDIGDCIYCDQDYFKLFPEEIRPWHAMLLWGTPYSRSYLHIDPYNWTGTNAVLKGRKRWKLFPPGQDHLLYVPRGKLSGFPLETYKYNSLVDSFDPNYKIYPLFKNAEYLEVDQLPGELMIIPTGWFHQVLNVEETIAISGQMMNDFNYMAVLEEIFLAGNLRRDSLPSTFDSMSPEEQIKTILSLLPSSILQKGQEVNKAAQDQLLHVSEPKKKNAKKVKKKQ